jgi:hypothetical protein
MNPLLACNSYQTYCFFLQEVVIKNAKINENQTVKYLKILKY